MATPPAKKFTADPATKGRADDSERRFTWFEPAKRRATQYEDVTVDTQPSIHRHIRSGDWHVKFEDGRGTWDDNSTLLKHHDWYAFRDPGQLWERNYYANGARYEAQIESAVQGAARDGLFADFDERWVEFLRSNLQVPAFAERGVWLGVASVTRDALSDTITRCLVFEGAMKQRIAQSLVLYAMDLEPHFGDMPIAPNKQRWLEHPAWQPTRKFVEALHASTDWGEVLIAVNLCFEPLIGATIRRELGIRGASANGDTVTPVVAHVAQVEYGWVADWTAEFCGFVMNEEEHGAANRQVLAGWLEKWTPMAREATEALGGIVEELPVGFDADAMTARVTRDALATWEMAGVRELVGVPA